MQQHNYHCVTSKGEIKGTVCCNHTRVARKAVGVLKLDDLYLV